MAEVCAEKNGADGRLIEEYVATTEYDDIETLRKNAKNLRGTAFPTSLYRLYIVRDGKKLYL